MKVTERDREINSERVRGGKRQRNTRTEIDRKKD